MNHNIIERIAEETNLKKNEVKGTVYLLDDGNTIPFIARYRKEQTGNLDEIEIRNISEKLNYFRNLEERRSEVIRLIDEQDKLTDKLAHKINHASILQEIEDLYRPYKRKRKTRAVKAREKGLEPLAEIVQEQEINQGSLEDLAQEYIDPKKELDSVEEVYQGVQDIIAECISDDAEIRKKIRRLSYEKGKIISKKHGEKVDEEGKYEMYYEYQERAEDLPPHRILALNRGEKEEILQVKLDVLEEDVLHIIRKKYIKNKKSIFYKQNLAALEDAYKRLIAPAIEREIRNKLTEKAEEHAVDVFSKNLRGKLLQPPYSERTIMGIDPGFRTGSKVCVVDKSGKLMDTATIFPHPPQKKEKSACSKLIELIKKHDVQAVAVGNGTACRETEVFLAEKVLKDKDLDYLKDLGYVIVDEAGASVYSASRLAREEFPELDVSMRGAVSIARRLQDPLSELVKIDPKSIGVGLYQHDIDQKNLTESLETVVESVVNYVGVDLNLASSSLLKYVAGVDKGVAKNIVKHREEKGRFKTREELKNVYRLGPKTFVQAAGFLRIANGEDPLANTPIHPESYSAARSLLEDISFNVENLKDNKKVQNLREVLNKIVLQKKSQQLDVGLPTLKDIIEALKRPGRDPREELPAPIFRSDVLKIDDLKPDMLLKGTVRNVVDFGAFIDIGIKDDGLVHISEMSDKYVEDPLDIVGVGDIVNVKILNIDKKRRRIALSMKI